VSGFIDVEDRLSGKSIQQLLVGLLQSSADLGDDLGQEGTREVDLDHIAEELADRGVGGVAEAFEVSDQSGQARAGQTAAFDHVGHDAIMDLAAVRAPAGVASVLLDQQRHLDNLDLLNDANVVTGRTQTVTAIGANLRDIIVRGRGEMFG
jgi:hypothetical protein